MSISIKLTVLLMQHMLNFIHSASGNAIVNYTQPFLRDYNSMVMALFNHTLYTGVCVYLASFKHLAVSHILMK